MNRAVLFVADIEPNFSGQSIIAKAVYSIFKEKYKIYHVPLSYNQGLTSHIYKILFVARFVSKAFSFLKKKHSKKVIYFTPSRGKISIIRDLIIILFLRILINKKYEIYAHLHGSDMKKRIDNSSFSKFFYDSYYKLNIRVILLSSNHAKFALGVRYPNYIYVPNYIQDYSVHDYEKKFKERDYQFKNILGNKAKIEITHLSGVLRDKGLDLVIEFVYCLNKTEKLNAKFLLNIIGWKRHDLINMFPKLKFFVENLEDQNLIKFHGLMGNKNNVYEILASSHFNILLSKSEAQPLSLLEGAILGCYTITNEVDFLDDLLNKIDGIINQSKVKILVEEFLQKITEIDSNFYELEKIKIRKKKILGNFSKKKFDFTMRKIID